MIDNSIQHNLIELSHIFKKGYTVEINNDSINQYNNTNKPYIVSYKTLITITDNNTTFKNVNIPNKCIIGAWLDTNTNTYYIELNKAFVHMSQALKFAYKHKQEYVYGINNSKLTKVKDWELKIKKWLHEQ